MNISQDFEESLKGGHLRCKYCKEPIPVNTLSERDFNRCSFYGSMDPLSWAKDFPIFEEYDVVSAVDQTTSTVVTFRHQKFGNWIIPTKWEDGLYEEQVVKPQRPYPPVVSDNKSIFLLFVGRFFRENKLSRDERDKLKELLIQNKLSLLQIQHTLYNEQLNSDNIQRPEEEVLLLFKEICAKE
eukprot:TRINITY_DN8983_c0_g1_i1.p2 TRINITY_DN8983_c0_g1~~TRINITY_DN8983_c0_g1_i1.p2  ORF type:complete len:184 (+),score=51.07 TRINITY_DN8983_c0_g1_i1:909-1460(+)